MAQGKSVEAENSFRRAIEIARTQSARMWELRATTSLARLSRSRVIATKRARCSPTMYGWFTEGFDTADLKDAKALIDELNE